MKTNDNRFEEGYKLGYEAGKKDAVKHGEWESYFVGDGTMRFFRCSECLSSGERTCRNYCPTCGAKMDKKESE